MTMEVNALEARLHRQDMQIEQLLTDMDNLNQNYQRYSALLNEFVADRGQVVEAAVNGVVEYINQRGLVSDSVTTVTTRLRGWEEEL